MKPRLYVDFNEMIETDLVMLSQKDFKTDSEGNSIELKEGTIVEIYMDDLNESNEQDNLIAKGIVELNRNESFKICKWNCRIDKDGIYHESDLNS